MWRHSHYSGSIPRERLRIAWRRRHQISTRWGWSEIGAVNLFKWEIANSGEIHIHILRRTRCRPDQYCHRNKMLHKGGSHAQLTWMHWRRAIHREKEHIQFKLGANNNTLQSQQSQPRTSSSRPSIITRPSTSYQFNRGLLVDYSCLWFIHSSYSGNTPTVSARKGVLLLYRKQIWWLTWNSTRNRPLHSSRLIIIINNIIVIASSQSILWIELIQKNSIEQQLLGLCGTDEGGNIYNQPNQVTTTTIITTVAHREPKLSSSIHLLCG